MSKWHVWGDYIHTRPERIGNARVVSGESGTAGKTAESAGFDIEKRTRNGFEPWAETFVSDDDEGQEFQFAAYPIVRGWRKMG